MADFQSQAMGLTGLTIDGSSTAPSRAEFSQFLSDGVIDVTSKHLAGKPLDDYLFLAVSSEQTSQGLDLNGARITSVIRESGTDNDWRDCSEIHPSRQGQVVSAGSLYLATTYNPVYTILDNGGISVFPAPDSDPNTFKVYYVNNSPAETDGTALDHASTGIKYFPNDKVYLVVLYAAVQSLRNALSAKTLPDAVTLPVLPASLTLSTVGTSLPSFTTPSAFVSPASLSNVDVSFSEVGSFPAFVKPVFSAPSLGSVGSLTLPTVPVAPSLTDNSISFSTSVPIYAGQVMAPDFSDANSHITDEDPEMVASRVQVIGAQVNEFSAKVQNELQEFNESNTEYQAQLQISIQNAQLSSKDDSNALQKYSAELGVYQAEVNAKVQEWVNEEWNQNFQKYQTDYGQLIQEHTSSIQSENNRVQNQAQEYQQKVNKALQTYQSETGYDVSKLNADIQKEVQRFTQDLAKENGSFQADINKYRTESDKVSQQNQNDLAKFSSDLQSYSSEFSNKIQDFNGRLQKSVADYNWMENRYKMLDAKYNTEFRLMSPQQTQ
jgi:hypothetical protein